MFSFKSTLRQTLDDTSGVAAVEAAILAPFLGVLGLGVMDCSFMLLQNHKMEQALVAAANYMSLSIDPRQVEDTAKRIAVSGTTDPLAKPLIKNWSPDDIKIEYRLVPNTSGQYRGGKHIRVVNITTTHPYQGFGILKAVTRNNVVLNAQYQQRMTSTAL